MKKLRKTSGTITLGTLTLRTLTLGTLTLGTFTLATLSLTGCGNGQADAALSIQPVDLTSPAPENQAEAAQPENGECITLTLGTKESDWILESAVEAYNAQSRQYHVDIVEYLPEAYDDAAVEAAMNRFCMDLATGKGTDIILFDDLNADELGHGGVVLDLYPFLTTEDMQKKYLGNILECARTGSALYDISPSFTLSFIAGDGSRIGWETGWTMEEMLNSFAQNGRDGLALARAQGRTVVRLAAASMEDYINWDTGTADFCKEEFYHVLEFGKTIDSSNYIRPTKESVSSGTHLASCEGLTAAADIQYLKWLFGDNLTIKGYPCSQGTGVAVSMAAGGSLGISASSRYPDGAWDFLEFYIDAAWTRRDYDAEGMIIQKDFSNHFPGFPINRKLFEEMLADSTVQQYDPNSGKPIPLLQGEGEIPDFYANTPEDVGMIREIITLADRRYFPDQSAISQIITEEISGYNAGVLTAEQTAQKIQNRVQLYLDEQKK